MISVYWLNNILFRAYWLLRIDYKHNVKRYIHGLSNGRDPILQKIVK